MLMKQEKLEKFMRENAKSKYGVGEIATVSSFKFPLPGDFDHRLNENI